MPRKIYIVDLTKEERPYLLDYIKSGKHSARKLNRARILLLADEGKTDSEISKALHTGTATVQRTRQRFVEGNLDGALNERPRLGRQKKLDEKGEAILETVAHSKPPEGRNRRNSSLFWHGHCNILVSMNLFVSWMMIMSTSQTFWEL